MKRSGEITEWGCRWDDQQVSHWYDAIAGSEEALSGKFRDRVCDFFPLEPDPDKPEVVSPGKQDAPGFDAAAVISTEFRHAAERQGSTQIANRLDEPLARYLGALVCIPAEVTGTAGCCVKRLHSQSGPRRMTRRKNHATPTPSCSEPTDVLFFRGLDAP